MSSPERKLAAARELVALWTHRASVADELAAAEAFAGEPGLVARLRDMAGSYRARARELAELLGP